MNAMAAMPRPFARSARAWSEIISGVGGKAMAVWVLVLWAVEGREGAHKVAAQ